MTRTAAQPQEQDESVLLTVEECVRYIRVHTGIQRITPRMLRAYRARGEFIDPGGVDDTTGQDLYTLADLKAWCATRTPSATTVRRYQRRLERAEQRAQAWGWREPLDQVVREARTAGLGWQQIADSLTAPHGGSPSRQAVQQRFRDIAG